MYFAMSKVACTVCRRSNQPWRKFCGGCGTHFAGGCICGFVNTPEDRFCGGCGNSIRNTLRLKDFGIDQVTMKIAIVQDERKDG